MAEEEKQESANPADGLMEDLQARASKQLKLIFGALFSSLVFLGALGFVYVSVNGTIVRVTQEPLTEMTNLAGLVSEEYANLNLALEFHNYQLESLSRRLDDVGPSVDPAQFDAVREVLVDQEADIEIFLAALKDSVFGLSEMVSGSRAWREDFAKKLDQAIESSRRRRELIGEQDNGADTTLDATDSAGGIASK